MVKCIDELKVYCAIKIKSGNVQVVKGVYIDCDKDCFVVKVEQTGAACHEGYRSCFFREVDSEGDETVVGEKLTEAYWKTA